MRNTEDQGEAENNGQKEKGFDVQRGVYRQRVWEAKSDVRWGERQGSEGVKTLQSGFLTALLGPRGHLVLVVERSELLVNLQI